MKHKIFVAILIMWAIILIGWAINSESKSHVSAEQITDKLEAVDTSSDTLSDTSTVQVVNKSTTKTITETTTETTMEATTETTTEDINRYFLQSLGEFKITVYTPYSDNGAWGYKTASGATSKHLRTCAVDPDVLPLGSVIVVNGLTLTAVDTGSAVKGKTIDIFFDGTESEAYEWIGEFGESAEVKLQYWGDYSEEHAPIK